MSTRLPRRHWLLGLAAAGWAGAGRAAPADGLVLRFALQRENAADPLAVQRSRFQNSVLMGFGETVRVAFDGQCRLSLKAEDLGAQVRVQVRVDDLLQGERPVGTMGALVPFDGEVTLVLDGSDGVARTLQLHASRRALPGAF